MNSAHKLHVDQVRLLGATERLLADGEPSADGSWEHWPRFCQFIQKLDGIQSQLQATVAETNRGRSPPPVPSAEDLTGYDRRLETLRRSRDDLASAATAAAAAASAKRTAAKEQQQQQDANESENENVSESAGPGSSAAVPMRKSPRASSPRRRQSTSKKTGGGGGGGGVFGGRRAEGGGGGGTGGGVQEADEAEADQVAQEISSMAGRLKESSMAINQTLRTQTQVLEDTGDAATHNVDRVKRENVRVAERLRKKRAAMFASWCMMLTVLVTFFATYALVILPFEKRRGPFVARSVLPVAQAAEQSQSQSQSQPVPSQQQQLDGSGGGAEKVRQRSEQAFREASDQARSKQQRVNADHRVMTAEKEASRQRQAERRRARQHRKAESNNAGGQQQQQQHDGAQTGKEEPVLPPGSCSAPPPSEYHAAGGAVASCSGPPPDDDAAAADATSADAAGSCSGPPTDDDTAAIPAAGSCSAPPPSDDGDGGDVDRSAEVAAAAAAQLANEHRRRADLEYEKRSRLEAQRVESSNAGLRMVAEEKEKYRQRQAEEMMRNALGPQLTAKGQNAAPTRRNVEEEEAADEAALRARAVEGSPEGAAAAETTATNDRPGDGDGGNAGDTGDDDRAGSVEAGGDEEIEAPGDKAEEGGTEAGGEGPVASGSTAGGSAEEGGDAASPSVDPHELGRRMAEEARIAYEKNSRRADESLVTQNAGLRIVAEEKEKYRQRQTQSIMEGARRRNQQQQQDVHQAELGDGLQKPADQEPRALPGNAAADPSSASATGLEAVRMRLRESLAAQPGDGDGGGADKSTGVDG